MKNDTYTIDCTGDACVKDEVQFEKAVFTGTYPKARFSHTETIQGEIVKDSYGDKKQQHTFTIQLPSGELLRIKGRNLYRNGCKRKPWINEKFRQEALDEKHERGDIARTERYIRKSNSNPY